jgi:hypothetical protein
MRQRAQLRANGGTAAGNAVPAFDADERQAHRIREVA